MPKLLGIGYGALPGFIERAQKVSLLGYGDYQFDGSDERDFTPYERGGIGAAPAGTVYDLTEPGRVAEIKRSLIGLAEMKGPSQLTDFWKHIDLSPQFADAWGGPVADAFVAAVGRYRDQGVLPGLMSSDQVFTVIPEFREKDKHGQDTGNYYWVGGAQPTVPGLELIAQAARQLAPGVPQMDLYWKWRADAGSDLKACTPGGFSDLVALKARCTPPRLPSGAFVPVSHCPASWQKCHGRPWIKDANGSHRSYVGARRNGPFSTPALRSEVDDAHQEIRDWLEQLALPGVPEEHRLQSLSMVLAGRTRLAEAAKVLNKLPPGTSPPSCPEGQKYSPTRAICEDLCPPGSTWSPAESLCVVPLDPVDITPFKNAADCLAHYAAHGMSPSDAKKECAHCSPTACDPPGEASAGVKWLIGGAAVVGAIWFYRRSRGKE